MMTVAMAIGGREVIAKNTFPVINPSTGKAFANAPDASLSDLDEAVFSARKAFPAWRDSSDAERQRACLAVADVIEKNSEMLAQLLTREQGKPLGGLGSRFELGGAVAWARHTAGLSLPVKLLQDDNAGRIELHHKPIGIVASITPWNWPLMIAVWHVLPALRAGNCVVIKPSPFTPLSTLAMINAIAQILPPGVINCISGRDPLGAALTQHAGVDKVVFTGSTVTGRKVFASCAETIKRMTLELGGNDAGIVLPDCDAQSIAPGLFWGAFINNGQTCAALKRLYVPDAIYEDVCQALMQFAANVKIGDGLDEANELGPIQNKAQFNKVSALVEGAKHQGGRVLTGGAPMAGPGYFYPVTLIADVEDGLPLVDEEQFGPVLPIIRYKDVDSAIEAANNNPCGLGGSIWSRDRERAKNLALKLECGSAWINKHGAIQPNAPFGGVKQSGYGVEFGEEGLREYTNLQTVFG